MDLLQFRAALNNPSRTRINSLLISNYIDAYSLSIKELSIHSTLKDIPCPGFIVEFLESDLIQMLNSSSLNQKTECNSQLVNSSSLNQKKEYNSQLMNSLHLIQQTELNYPSYVWVSLIKLISRLLKRSLFLNEIESAISTMIHAEVLWDMSKLFSLSFKYLRLKPSQNISSAVYYYCVKHKNHYLQHFQEECVFFGSRIFINTETFKMTLLCLLNYKSINPDNGKLALLRDISGERLYLSFIRDDSHYIQLVLSTINAFPRHCLDTNENLDALKLFNKYFETVAYDPLFLLDLVMSNETDILACLVKIIKYSVKSKETCGCGLHVKVVVMLRELSVLMNKSKDIRFNTQPLLKLIKTIAP